MTKTLSTKDLEMAHAKMDAAYAAWLQAKGEYIEMYALVWPHRLLPNIK